MKKYHEIEHLRPLEVEVNDSSEESFQFAVRLFRSKVQKERILAEVKKRSRYEKPSVKKRRKIRENQNREFLLQRAVRRQATEEHNENK
jgi:small subunit ribosomal protein S21